MLERNLPFQIIFNFLLGYVNIVVGNIFIHVGIYLVEMSWVMFIPNNLWILWESQLALFCIRCWRLFAWLWRVICWKFAILGYNLILCILWIWKLLFCIVECGQNQQELLSLYGLVSVKFYYGWFILLFSYGVINLKYIRQVSNIEQSISTGVLKKKPLSMPGQSRQGLYKLVQLTHFTQSLTVV